jgi:RNA polymerase sigma-70 factor (ECF subfamily)
MPRASDDADWVRKCLRGDRDAFGELIRGFEHTVHGLALSYVRNFADAEDLAQEAFVSAYLNQSHLQDPSRSGAWLKATVVNRCKNAQRSRRTEKASCRGGRR